MNEFEGVDSVLGRPNEITLKLMDRGMDVRYPRLKMSKFVAYSSIAEFVCHFGDSENNRIRIVARSGSIICDVIFSDSNSIARIKDILENRIG